MTEHNNPQDNVTVLRELLRQAYAEILHLSRMANVDHTERSIIGELRTALEQPAVEPVAWGRNRFIEDVNGVPIGTDEPELQWGRYIPDEDGGWFPLFTAPKAQPDEKPVGEVAPYPDVVDWYSDEPPIGTKLYTAPQAQEKS